MAQYRIEVIADLARQMGFAPSHARVAQLDNAESLLHSLQPGKAYPLEYVVFRITGYHPKTVLTAAQGAGEELLTGLALQHDLGVLIEAVSDSLSVSTASVGEPVLTIEDVTERFNVTSKTIQRWRRKGLPARRFVFPDGKRRVGFLVRSIEQFVSLHSEEINQATNFSHLSGPEHDAIIARARRLATTCQCCMHEIARRIAKKLHRSHLTVLHTIRKHDIDHPAEAVFPLAAEPVGGDDRVRMVRGFRKGTPLRVLAKRSCRPRAVVYRVILEERIDRLTRRKQKFIDDTVYHQPGAAMMIADLVRGEELAAPRATDERMPRDLPPYFQALYRTPLLTPGRERALFLKFNYHKYLFVTARRALDPMNARAKDLDLLEGHLRDATDVKNAIVAANLRLVVSIAKRHLRPGVSLMELVSDGNITLMRAVESFDFHKGNKFSTYATLALMKGYARSVPLMLAAKRKAGAGEEMLSTVADAGTGQHASRLAAQDELRTLLSSLEPAERAALVTQFGLDPASPTLQDLALSPRDTQHALALSRPKLKKLEQQALTKLREAAGLLAE